MLDIWCALHDGGSDDGSDDGSDGAGGRETVCDRVLCIWVTRQYRTRSVCKGLLTVPRSLVECMVYIHLAREKSTNMYILRDWLFRYLNIKSCNVGYVECDSIYVAMVVTVAEGVL